MNAREEFWKGEFGNEYNRRSPGDEEANFRLFKKALFGFQLASIVELGAGTGANLRALHRLRPGAELTGVEINPEACRALEAMPCVAHGMLRVVNESILGWAPKHRFELAFTKGVLIHIAPE